MVRVLSVWKIKLGADELTKLVAAQSRDRGRATFHPLKQLR